eukprot:TRINITY_DN11136_c0_g1_i1.p1 TRINITY_DN11136_c0_g1~~TRINITY_DN11136_c0_g1_i1.p1  ORF type:complete len:153 (+),score=14.79 TRINITY_DN11136_c0_g1_i1:234-692(+)
MPAGSLRRAMQDIYAERGPQGYFRGLTAFCPRVVVASGVQLSTYDATKRWLMRDCLMGDGVGCHFVASWITGLAVVMCMQPFDFAATRVTTKHGATHYKGPVDCIQQTIRTEGMLAIYKGVSANYLRFGPYCILTFLFLEQLRKLNPSGAVR